LLHRTGEQSIARARSPLIEQQVECDGARSFSGKTIEHLRMKVSRPGIELGGLANGACSVA
jgi:hypothetical protein